MQARHPLPRQRFSPIPFSCTSPARITRRRAPVRLGPALAGGDRADETAADFVLNGAVAERAADQLVAAQRGEAGIIGVRIEEIGEIRRPVEERRRLDEPASRPARCALNARTGPVPRALDHPRGRRVQRDSARRRHQVVLVHGDRAEPPETDVRSRAAR